METMFRRLWLPLVLAVCILVIAQVTLAAWSDPGPMVIDDSETLVGYDSSMAGAQIATVEVAGISYYDGSRGALKFALGGAGGSSWISETVDNSSAKVGQDTSLVIYLSSASLYPFISYYDASNGNLKFARSSGSS